MNRAVLYSILLAMLICCTVPATTQQQSSTSVIVPRLIRFGGVLKDSTGKPQQGVAGITFALYKEQEGGAALWLETQNVSLDASGHYSVLLGSTQEEGVPMDLFTSGQAQWLGVHAQGQPEQPRIWMVSVPYALKAADADTLGGLPASAFVLAAPPAVAGATSPQSQTAAPLATGSTPVTTAGGTTKQLPLWDSATDITNSVITQTGTGSTARIGINTTTPASTLDVKGSEMVRGTLSLPATGTATSTAGFNSQPETFAASAFNRGTGAAVSQNFRWQAEPVGNNTASTSGTLNLLYAAGSNTPSETGLKINNKGQITFPAGQTFPGSTITGNETVHGNISASGQLISTVATGTPPLKVTSTTQVPNLNASFLGGKPASTFATLAANAFSGNQIINGSVGIGTSTPAEALDLGNNNNMVIRVDPGNDTSGGDGGYGLVGRGAGGVPNTWWTFTAPVGGGFGVPVNSYSIWQYPPNAVPGCCLNRFTILPAESPGDTGGTVTIDQNGNTSQPRTAGGWAKAMVHVQGLIAPYSITACFNSTLTGAAATTPPCGINFTEGPLGQGEWTLDFGFEVGDRFLSATIDGELSGCVAVHPGSTLVGVTTYDCGTSLQGAQFYLIVF